MFRGPLWRFVDTELRRALEEQLTVREACDRWYSGAFLLETVPSALYILARHSDDPEKAILKAVNDTKDNDTIAAIVGAAVGALHGRLKLPSRWVDGLLGRTAESDDRRIFELMAMARERWG
jgi:ADP-ribosylglycohydrolase